MRASNTIDLERLQLRPGDGRRLEVPVDPGSLEYGEETYASSVQEPAVLDVSRMAAGYAIRLRLRTTLEGPCMRCLGAACIDVEVEAREVDQPGGGEELESPYVEGGELRVADLAHDARDQARLSGFQSATGSHRRPAALRSRSRATEAGRYHSAPHGRPEEANLAHAPRQAPRHAPSREAAPQRVPALSQPAAAAP